MRDEQLNCLAARGFFEDMGRMAPEDIGNHLTDDYMDDDPSYPEPVRGVEGVREQYAGWRAAFDFAFRIDDQMAQDDQVCTRWTWSARHNGEFLGIAATGQDVFVHMETLRRAGLADVEPDQRLRARIVPGRKGPLAVGIAAPE